MKNKILFTLTTACIVLLIGNSCNKKVALTHPIKAWFDAQCSTCHASGKASAAKWLYDAADYEGSIKTHVTHINTLVTVSKTMPPTGLTAAQLAEFTAWFAAGSPAK